MSNLHQAPLCCDGGERASLTSWSLQQQHEVTVNPGSSLQWGKKKSWIVSICGTFTDPKNDLTSFLVFIWKRLRVMWSPCRDSDGNFASDLFQRYVLPRRSVYKHSRTCRGWSFLDFKQQGRAISSGEVEERRFFRLPRGSNKTLYQGNFAIWSVFLNLKLGVIKHLPLWLGPLFS